MSGYKHVSPHDDFVVAWIYVKGILKRNFFKSRLLMVIARPEKCRKLHEKFQPGSKVINS